MVADAEDAADDEAVTDEDDHDQGNHLSNAACLMQVSFSKVTNCAGSSSSLIRQVTP